ncbi:NADPH-dependent FMN reductase [Flavobacterium sp. NST-5]|uniref:NADPH-dependent FMN reductase n=1 Tax=Flavobacterium ichthyis TaxID=2698827 RepID=A0ABW9Z4Z0_9FLAO|nr:NAD(P)H-dependent oxidoreductase [Flavobacterium ichthyis]NBL63906.1 NADPH-dependent FMN reductase [Flavobacterium ichthyis]
MKIIAFGGSSSKQSINKKLATYAAGLFENADVEILDLNDFELPLFSVDKEAEIGKPELATKFLEKLDQADILVISLAEHNAGFSVAFKNIYDWASRTDKLVFREKPMLLLATSPGRGGGKNVIEAAKISLPKYGGNIKDTFSLPSFNENFDSEKNVISNPEFDNRLKQIIRNFATN